MRYNKPYCISHYRLARVLESINMYLMCTSPYVASSGSTLLGSGSLNDFCRINDMTVDNALLCDMSVLYMHG